MTGKKACLIRVAGAALVTLLLTGLAACAPVAADAPAATAPFSVTRSPTPSPVPTPTPVPTPFSIAWFPDTQHSAYEQEEALTALGTYVRTHREAENIVQVVQTGDLVEYAGHQREWNAFYSAYDQYAETVPYFAICGNHDMLGWPKTMDVFLSQRFWDQIPDAQKFQNGMAAYTLLNAGGTDFIIAGSGYDRAEECTPWLNEVLSQHRDRVAILLFHDYLHQTRGLYDSGPYLFEHVVQPNANVRLILCGHYRGTRYRLDQFDDNGDGTAERTVHTMLFNYQHMTQGGHLRMLTFDPATRALTVRSFNAMNGRRYRDFTKGTDTFTLEDAF